MKEADAERTIVVLTGAGVSAESGLPTFRGAGGLWEGHRVEEVATPEAFARDPAMVHRFYNERRKRLREVEPNHAHQALARLESAAPGRVILVTQNVDDLHERAGSRNVLHMHGELRKARCTACGDVWECPGALGSETPCPRCGSVGGVRPHIVWFGEIPFHLDTIERALQEADLFIAAGTSGVVYPAAGFAGVAGSAGARTIEVNLERTAGTDLFDEARVGPASQVLPALVDAILGGEA